MYNVLLDPLPESWQGYRINTDFRIGIQMQQAMEDDSLSAEEKYETCATLLFPDSFPDTAQKIWEAVEWFLTDYNHDNEGRIKKGPKAMDWNVDQWRIYAAFLSQYNIDLHTTKMHWFVFMGLFTNLNECALHHVMDIRSRKIEPDMKREQKEQLREYKARYSLENMSCEETEDEKRERMTAVDEFNRLRKAGS